jgi:ABC-type multidrug transport system ATPase subunit
MAPNSTVPAIRTERLTKRFGDVLALDGLDLSVERGEIFGFLGPNGAGKSTTIRLLLHLIHPTGGRAEIMGIPVSDTARAHRHVGYVSGDVALWPQLTGTEALRLLGNLSGGVDEAYRDELLERLELDPSRRIRTLSKGNRQKVALVAAFMHQPDVLLLDEPTAGLDPLKEAEFQQIVREVAPSAGRRSSCPRTSSTRSRTSAPAWPSCAAAGSSRCPRWTTCGSRASRSSTSASTVPSRRSRRSRASSPSSRSRAACASR